MGDEDASRANGLVLFRFLPGVKVDRAVSQRFATVSDRAFRAAWLGANAERGAQIHDRLGVVGDPFRRRVRIGVRPERSGDRCLVPDSRVRHETGPAPASRCRPEWVPERPAEMAAMAPAVERPIPGSASRAATLVGISPLCSVTTCCAALCRFRPLA